ncbi:hypothetical protein [Nocardia sp. NBC_00416]|uniref:hypothetical protein n=1 Tax=Nocardia sp. NBC_00416 TaxID=2975991 RepID=UPI002E208B52
MSAESITLSFVGTGLSTANRPAGELHDLLLEELDATCVRRAGTELNQDVGATLVLAGAMSATPAATDLARGCPVG